MMKDLTERKAVYLDDAIDAIVGCTNCGTEDELRAYVTRHSLEDVWSGGIVDALDAIEQLPSAQPEQRWISCSERLPENEQFVLATYKTTDRIHVCQYHEDGSRNQWYSLNDMCRAHNNVVIAWMPLPEPYEERRTDE